LESPVELGDATATGFNKILIMETTTTQSTAVRQNTGRLYFWLGVAAPIVGIGIFLVQFLVAHIFKTPWYLPIFGTAGVLLVILALARKRNIGRFAGLIVVCLLAGFEWFLVSGAAKLPEYKGPVAAGQPFPAFAATFADGSPFTQDSLHSDKNTALVFFRGRW
jgi:hypothetical protein